MLHPAEDLDMRAVHAKAGSIVNVKFAIVVPQEELSRLHR